MQTQEQFQADVPPEYYPEPKLTLLALAKQITESWEKKLPLPKASFWVFAPKDWIAQSRVLLLAEIREAVKAAPAPPESLPLMQELLEKVLLESWKETVEPYYLRAWMQRYLAAKTPEERRAVALWAKKRANIDQWRKLKRERALFVSLDELEERASEDAAAEGSHTPAAPLPGRWDNHEAASLQEKFRKAIAELPPELAEIMDKLPDVNFKASKLARKMGIPQRRMARRVADIRKHLAKRGLKA